MPHTPHEPPVPGVCLLPIALFASPGPAAGDTELPSPQVAFGTARALAPVARHRRQSRAASQPKAPPVTTKPPASKGDSKGKGGKGCGGGDCNGRGKGDAKGKGGKGKSSKGNRGWT